MPSPKAVLRDITDHGLDPNKAHHRVSTTGRLASVIAAAVAPATKAALVDLKPPHKVEAKVEKKPEPVVVETKVEEKTVVEAPAPKVEVSAPPAPVAAAPAAKPVVKTEKKEAPKATETVVVEASKTVADAKKA